jgi:7-cyano-7-deazaguanine synthase
MVPPFNGRKAVVLLSGGLDSATVLAHVLAEGYEAHALSFSYGQRQTVELEAAEHLAKTLGAATWRLAHVDLRAMGGSALTSDLEVPAANPQNTAIPVTYVPARNTIFLSYALGWAEVLGAYDLFIGANAVDYSGYPDCRPAFVQAFEHLANLATRAADGGPRYRVHAPLMHLKKKDIIVLGQSLGVDYGLTHSCYDPVGSLACGRCDACYLRRKGFLDAGVTDPTRYAEP